MRSRERFGVWTAVIGFSPTGSGPRWVGSRRGWNMTGCTREGTHHGRDGARGDVRDTTGRMTEGVVWQPNGHRERATQPILQNVKHINAQKPLSSTLPEMPIFVIWTRQLGMAKNPTPYLFVIRVRQIGTAKYSVYTWHFCFVFQFCKLQKIPKKTNPISTQKNLQIQKNTK